MSCQDADDCSVDAEVIEHAMSRHSRLRLVLLQVRSHRGSLLQERECFVERCGIGSEQLHAVNLIDEPGIRWEHVRDAHAVFIGGSGDYSVREHYPFTEALTEVIHRLIEDDRPVLGTCWGHQFLAHATDGVVVEDLEASEVGSFDVELTREGLSDPLFAGFPTRFCAQLGHKDRVSKHGPGWEELAFSSACPNQAIRLRGKPVYGTQFHGDMSEQRFRERLNVYRAEYAPNPGDYERITELLRPSPQADQVLGRFLTLYA